MRRFQTIAVLQVLSGVICLVPVTGFAPIIRASSDSNVLLQAAADRHKRSDNGLASFSLGNESMNVFERANQMSERADEDESVWKTPLSSGLIAAAVPSCALIFMAAPAEAATGSGGSFVSALVAYIHYASLLTIVGILVTERLLVKPEMTFEEEELLWKTDALYGFAGLALTISGYYRVVDYGKGWEFYSHEPLFWLKLVLVGIWGASSFFPTITIIKRVFEQRKTGVYPPLSEKLAARLIQVINAELLAIASVPLVATLMSRGVLYGGEDFPWPQVGAGLLVLTFGGAAFKYVKEALTWTEEEDDDVVVLED